MSVFSKIFGTHSQHEVKRIMPIVDKIEALASEYENMTDEEWGLLKNKMRDAIRNGEVVSHE